MADAMKKHPEVDVLINFASLRSAYDSTIETMNYAQVVTGARLMGSRNAPEWCPCHCLLGQRAWDSGLLVKGESGWRHLLFKRQGSNPGLVGWVGLLPRVNQGHLPPPDSLCLQRCL